MQMFSDYPSLHPLAVHFPIVLILLALAFQSVVVWKPQWIQIRWATLIIMAAAFLSALAASTVFHAMLAPNAPKSSWKVFNEHEKYAQYTLWISGLTLILKSIGDFYKLDKRSYHSIVLVSAVAAAIFLSIAGHHGARLVHIEGVGPMGKYLGTEEDEMNMENMEGMDNEEEDSTMKMDTTMPSMNGMNNTDSSKKSMNDMKGMDMKESGSKKDNMNDMKGMDMKGDGSKKDNMNDMKGMDMGSMKMNKMNPMDTIILDDNNPGRKPKKKSN